MSSFWNPEVDSMVSYAESVKQEYSTVIIDDLDLAYTYFAFYAPFSPEKLQSDAEWIQSGFVQVATFEKYSFLGQPDWDDLTASELEHWFDADESTVLVVRKGEPSAETKRDHAIVWEKKDHRGQWFWHAFEVDKTDLKPKLQPQSY